MLKIINNLLKNLLISINRNEKNMLINKNIFDNIIENWQKIS